MSLRMGTCFSGTGTCCTTWGLLVWTAVAVLEECVDLEGHSVLVLVHLVPSMDEVAYQAAVSLLNLRNQPCSQGQLFLRPSLDCRS